MRLLAFNFLFVGLVAVSAYGFQELLSKRLRADFESADLALASAIGQEVGDTMANALQAVRQMARYPEVIQADEAGMTELFSTLMSVRNDVNLVYRLDSNGIMLFHYPIGPDSTRGWDFSFRDYFARAKTTQNPLVSIGRISPTTEQPVATAVMPLWDEERNFQGVVATNIKLQSFSHALSSIVEQYKQEESFQVTIVDSAGQIVAHPDPRLLLSDADATMPVVVTNVVSGLDGTDVITDPRGSEKLYSYIPIHSIGWGVIVSRPTNIAFASLYAFQRGMTIAIGLFLIGGFLFWLALSRQFIAPLEKLAQFSQAIGRNEVLSEEKVSEISQLSTRSDQIGRLTLTLESMQLAIYARMNELSTLLQTSAAVVSTLDSSKVLDRILEQVEQLMGVQMSAVFVMEEEQQNFRVRASRGLSPWYIENVVVEPGSPDSVIMRAIRSGEPVQVSDTESNPAYDAQRDRARQAGYRSVLGVPLVTQHAPPSAILVYLPEAHVFSDREVNLLSSFANHAAMAIENASLFAKSDMRLQEQTRRLEALMHSMQDGLVLEDLGGKVLYANRRMLEYCMLRADHSGEISVAKLMEPLLASAVDRPAAEKAIDLAVQGENNRQTVIELLSHDKSTHIQLRVFDVTDNKGTLIGRGRILRDITQRYEVDRMKSSLIATVSHELRTPLASIKGYVSTLLADDVQWDSDSQQEFLSIISAETDHLSDLVSDLMDMSRIEAGNLKVKREICDLDELVLHAALRAHTRPGNRLRVDIPAQLPALYADPGRLEVIMRNLIENAAKYSEEHSPIWVRAVVNDGHLVVQVEDEGLGIPHDQREQIFDSFYRVENGLTRRTAGAGLGLAITRGFVRAHGGKIWLEPREKGTCVAFSLPLAARGDEKKSGEKEQLPDQ